MFNKTCEIWTNTIAMHVEKMMKAHIDAVVDLHMESFQGFFLTFLGRGFLKLYYEGVISHPDSIPFIARAGEDILGFVVGTMNPSGFYSALLNRQWLRFAVASIPAVLRRPRYSLRLMRAIRRPQAASKERGKAELTSLAVRPQDQSKGIGERLVKIFMKEVERRGGTSIYLTTDALNNDNVNAFYKKMGFALLCVTHTPEGRCMNEFRVKV